MESAIETKEIGLEDGFKVPNLTESVSQSKDGRLHATITNLSLDESEEIEGIFTDSEVELVKGTILTGNMRAHNSFDALNEVHTEEFTAVSVTDAAAGRIKFTIPPRSVLHLEVDWMPVDSGNLI